MNIVTEDDIIDAVIAHLRAHGWTIAKRCTADERGDDIVAERKGERLVIEAKGAGSSKAHTRRYGQEFSSGQVFDHVAKAILKALRTVSIGVSQAAIALPGNEDHRREVRQVLVGLQRAGIKVFWVFSDGKVTVEPSENEAAVQPA